MATLRRGPPPAARVALPKGDHPPKPSPLPCPSASAGAPGVRRPPKEDEDMYGLGSLESYIFGASLGGGGLVREEERASGLFEGPGILGRMSNSCSPAAAGQPQRRASFDQPGARLAAGQQAAPELRRASLDGPGGGSSAREAPGYHPRQHRSPFDASVESYLQLAPSQTSRPSANLLGPDNMIVEDSKAAGCRMGAATGMAMGGGLGTGGAVGTGIGMRVDMSSRQPGYTYALHGSPGSLGLGTRSSGSETSSPGQLEGHEHVHASTAPASGFQPEPPLPRQLASSHGTQNPPDKMALEPPASPPSSRKSCSRASSLARTSSIGSQSDDMNSKISYQSGGGTSDTSGNKQASGHCINFTDVEELCQVKELDKECLDGLYIIHVPHEAFITCDLVFYSLVFSKSSKYPLTPGDDSLRKLIPRHLFKRWL